MDGLEEVSLGIDEVEALRLKDLLALEQDECAKRMNLAQSTFQRILTAARNKVSKAIIEGKAMRIEGGNYLVCSSVLSCAECQAQRAAEGGSHHPFCCPSCGNLQR